MTEVRFPGAARLPLVHFLSQNPPASYAREVEPVLKKNCFECHNPKKAKGKLDMTTVDAFKKGGKSGPSFVPGAPEKSKIVEMISGAKPEMPNEGDPLKPAEVALIARWIKEGAKFDGISVYAAPPVISALAYSPDGKLLAVSGYREILLHGAEGLVARLGGDSARIEALAFSADGKRLVAGGDDIQIWDVQTRAMIRSISAAASGASISPDGSRVAYGFSDKTARVLQSADGKELMKFEGTDAFGTAMMPDGARVATVGRDRKLRLIHIESGKLIGDVEAPEPLLCIARHPSEDVVACGGALGTPYVYRMTKADVSRPLVIERQPGAVRAIAFSPDGLTVAVGGLGPEARIYSAKDGSRVATLPDNGGAIFAMAFHPAEKQIAVGGADGQVRIFDLSGKLVKAFIPVPIQPK